jgi:hypothetical protein
MLFKEIIAVYSEDHMKRNKYKQQRYGLLQKTVHIVTSGLRWG